MSLEKKTYHSWEKYIVNGMWVSQKIKECTNVNIILLKSDKDLWYHKTNICDNVNLLIKKIKIIKKNSKNCIHFMCKVMIWISKLPYTTNTFNFCNIIDY